MEGARLYSSLRLSVRPNANVHKGVFALSVLSSVLQLTT